MQRRRTAILALPTGHAGKMARAWADRGEPTHVGRDAGPHAVRLRPAGEQAGRHSRRRWSHGRREARDSHLGCLGLLSSLPAGGRSRDVLALGHERGCQTRGRSLCGSGSSRPSHPGCPRHPGVRQGRGTRQKTHATSPRHLGLAEGQKWHQELGQRTRTGPGRCLQNRGQIGRQVVVQRPGGPVCIQKPRALRCRHGRRRCFDHLVGT